MHNDWTNWWLAAICVGLGIVGLIVSDHLKEMNATIKKMSNNVEKIEQRTKLLDSLPVFDFRQEDNP